MAAIPCVREPSSPASASPCSTTSTPKSRFRFPFNWRKSSSRPQGPYASYGDERAIQAPSADDQDSRLNSSSSRLSGYLYNAGPTRPSSSQRPRSRKHEKIVTDPPPLAQVRGQALLHATLESPISYWEKPKSRKPSLSLGMAVSRDVIEDIVEVKRSHRRTNSGQSCCSTRSKIFFLVNGGYVMQYDGDSEGDALPEKILVLDRDSIARACDTVPGHPWVLQVIGADIGDAPQAPTLRPSWSRLSLRQTDKKKAANILLLIFDDSEDLRTWLYAIRKEIEHLGGMTYGEEREEDKQSWKDDLTKKFAAAASRDFDSNNTATSCKLSPLSSPLRLYVPGRSSTSSRVRPQSTESATSSKKTSTSLDRLRDSVASYSCTSTIATSSEGGSTPSTSPDCEYFPNSKSITDHLSNDLILRAYSPTGHQLSSNSSAPGRSILERRKLSVESLHLAQPERSRVLKAALTLPSTIASLPNDLTQHLVDSLAGSNAIHDASIRRSASTNTTNDYSRKSGLHRPHSAHKDLSRNSSPIEAASGLPKIRYTLFPTPHALETKLETPIESKPTLPDTSSSMLKAATPKHRKNRSRTLTLELRQHRISTLLAAGGYDPPQRSPAATDDMITFNFGVARDDAPASPLPDVKVPGLSDLYIDLDFLTGSYKEQHDQSSTPDSRKGSIAPAVSSVYSTKGPAGPPPVGPLPAVPTMSRRSSKVQRRSQHSRQNSAKRDNVVNTDKNQRRGNDKIFVPCVRPSTCEAAVREPRQRRRTISSSLDVPTTRLACKPHSETKQTRSESRSRVRRKSDKQ